MDAMRLGQISGDELVDREGQLAVLDACWEALVSERSGRLVLLSGEAGAGKTALLRRFWSGREPQTRVLWAACDPLSTPQPLGPLFDIGRALEGPVREQLDNGGQPRDVADALICELDSYVSPAVVILEDVHWADDATLDVVRILARRIEPLAVLLVLSFREEELGRFHPLRGLLGDLASPSPSARLEVPPLSPEAVATLAAGSELDPCELHARTGGNAFFVTETLAATGDGLPATVRDAVLARAARLQPPARAALDAASIVPGGIEQWLLDELIGAPAGALEESVAAGVLRFDAAGVAFRHELARLAVEESIPPDARLRLHRRALAALRRAPAESPSLARLAYHAEAAADAGAVLEFAPAAAEEAARLGAHSEAQAQFGRALRFAGAVEDSRRAMLLERFAEEGYLTDMREGALDAITEAIAIRSAAGDDLEHGRDLDKRAGLLSCLGRTGEACADSRLAVGVLERIAPSADLAIACGGLCYSLMTENRHAEARLAGERGLELAESLNTAEPLYRVLCHFGTALLVRGEEGGREALERSLALALEADDGPRAGVAYINLVSCLGIWRRWPEAEPLLEAGLEYTRARGLDAWEQCLLANRVDCHLTKGDWDAAGETALAVLAGSPEWHAEPRAAALWGLGLVRARRGDPGCWQPLDEALGLAEEIGEMIVLAEVAIARAEVRWLEGDAEGVLAEAERALPLALKSEQGLWIGALACWRRRAGRPSEPPAGCLAGHRLQLRGEDREAAAIWRAADAPYDAALALLDADSTDAWHESLEIFTTLGARPAAAIAARRLREAGERGIRRGPRQQTQANPLSLTTRQLEVLSLLAQGMRNSEIADRLVLSHKTVDHHVSAILGKLEVRSRGEASAKAIALGVVATPGSAAAE